MNLVQLRRGDRRAAALVDNETLRLLDGFESVYSLIWAGLRQQRPVRELIHLSPEQLSYQQVWEGNSPWSLLPPADVPDAPHRVLISGTGLTHLASVQRRDAMHVAAASGAETDSMRMYRWGTEGGKPPPGQTGTAPEWFYKGNGLMLGAHREVLSVPGFAEDGGEEPEIAGVYLIGPDSVPVRIGFAQGNEFSDHKLERRNYLYLAHSKLRSCSLGPELCVDAAFDDVHGTVRVQRDGTELWSSDLRTGERNMCHSLANIEHHHFKYPQHRVPGDLHIHFFGADAFSFGSGIELQSGDLVQIAFEGFGRPLVNPVSTDDGAYTPAPVRSLV